MCMSVCVCVCVCVCGGGDDGGIQRVKIISENL